MTQTLTITHLFDPNSYLSAALELFFYRNTFDEADLTIAVLV